MSMHISLPTRSATRQGSLLPWQPQGMWLDEALETVGQSERCRNADQIDRS
jgi:hypothetical protein